MSDLIGQQRGNYQLTRLLGSGGFADVYLGEQIHLGNKVAIKILNARLDARGIQQFQNEARTLLKLEHPHIIKVLDFGFEKEIPYLIMAYAPNGTLAERHPIGTPLPTATVIEYVKQIAEALQYAHNNNVIHRDIKPENMLIGQNNTILLSDFGIARVMQTYTMNRQTQTASAQDHIIGSFHYMAPEQGAGRAVFASDQYSLAIVAYQWLCGSLPFQGRAEELMIQHRLEPPPPLPSDLHILPSVENVILKALAKDPNQRFASIQEFALALEQASKEQLRPAKRRSPTPIGQQPIFQLPRESAKAIDTDALYRQGVEAYARKDLEEAERCWQQVLTQSPNYGNGTLKPRLEKLQQELQPIRSERLRRQAQERIASLRAQAQTYSKAGRWQQAIDTYNQLLQLEPDNAQTKERLSTAQHNLQYAWMYETAQQFVREGKRAAAKTELTNLWQEAPDYGDPAGLSRQVGGIRPNRANFIKSKLGITNTRLWFSIFTFLSGAGTVIGIFATNWTDQSWIVAIIVTAILALIAYWLGYYKATGPFMMIVITLLSLVAIFAVTWFTSKLGYNHSELSNLLWVGNRRLWLGRQINLGLISGLTPCLFILLIIDELEGALFDFSTQSLMIVAGLVASLILWLLLIGIALFFGGSFGGWGWGFGYGWYFAWLAPLPAILLGAGIFDFITICRT